MDYNQIILEEKNALNELLKDFISSFLTNLQKQLKSLAFKTF